MKAGVLRQAGAQIEIEDVQLDDPGPREILVRTAAASVCHSDYSVRSGQIPWQMPVVMGHESAGVVEAVGSQVTYCRPGDRVITCLSIFCGQCEYCLTGRPVLCRREGIVRGPGERPRITQDGVPLGQFVELGSFAEQLLVHETAVVKVDDAMPLDRAAMLGCGVLTGLGAVFNTARLPATASVAVIGCGGVGLGAIQAASISGARQVIALDPVPARLERAKRLGATHVVEVGNDDPVQQVRDLSGGGVEYSFEAVGAKATCEQALRMLRPGGTATLVGVIDHVTLEINGLDLRDERKLQNSKMGSNRFRIDIPRYVDLYLQGRLQLDELVTDRLPLERLNDAFDAMGRGEGARSVIVFD